MMKPTHFQASPRARFMARSSRTHSSSADRPSRLWINIWTPIPMPLAALPFTFQRARLRGITWPRIRQTRQKSWPISFMPGAPLLEMRGICKRFSGVVALDNVSLAVGQGEVVALCGENGAGKSTLMKILGGVHQPDAGEILAEGRPTKISNVGDAIRLGIAFIHQELNVLGNLDVAGNVFLR